LVQPKQGTQRRVQSAAVGAVAVAGRQQEGVLLGMDADAGVVFGAGGGVGGTARTAALGAVGDTHRGAVVAGGDDRLVDHHQRADLATDAVGSLRHRARYVHVVLIPAGSVHRQLRAAEDVVVGSLA